MRSTQVKTSAFGAYAGSLFPVVLLHAQERVERHGENCGQGQPGTEQRTQPEDDLRIQLG